MEPGKIVRELLDFHRKNFENNMKTMMLLLEQTEKMMGLFLEEVPELSEEGRRAVEDWISQCKKGRIEFARRAQDGYKKIEAALL